MKNKNKISKQKNTTNLSEPDANQERKIAQKKCDRRLDGANRRGTRYACFRWWWNFSYHFQLFVEDMQLTWKNVYSSLRGKRIHLFISPILYTILSLRRPNSAITLVKMLDGTNSKRLITLCPELWKKWLTADLHNSVLTRPRWRFVTLGAHLSRFRFASICPSYVRTTNSRFS